MDGSKYVTYEGIKGRDKLYKAERRMEISMDHIEEWKKIRDAYKNMEQNDEIRFRISCIDDLINDKDFIMQPDYFASNSVNISAPNITIPYKYNEEIDEIV